MYTKYKGETEVREMQLRAFAKINLGLDVVRKREDGYHEVRMIMQTIQMYDLLKIEKCEKPGIQLTTNLPYVPCDGRNLVHKAAKLLMDEFDITAGLSIDLKKFIPVSAGMAGGSSDAAAAMVGVNRLFNLKLSMEELMQRSVQIGADVPYCILRGTALAEGIGEILTPLPPVPFCYILVGKPGVNVSTKTAYENLHLDSIHRHPAIDDMIWAIENQDLYGMAGLMENVFEPGIISQYPVIQRIEDFMMERGAINAVMSGSGPTVFGVFDSREKVEKAADELRESHLAKTVFATKVFNHGGKTNDK